MGSPIHQRWSGQRPELSSDSVSDIEGKGRLESTCDLFFCVDSAGCRSCFQ